MKTPPGFWVIGLLFLALTACTRQSGAANGIEKYIQALSEKNRDQVINASCKAWEEQATIEVDSLELVGTKLEGLACQESGSDGDSRLVTCQGKIITTYDAETVELDLTKNTYIAVDEDGSWKMCGYR